MKTAKEILIIVLVLAIGFFIFKRCAGAEKTPIGNTLNVELEKTILQLEKYELRNKILTNELIQAKKKAQNSESKYYALKRKIIKPKYIESISDCNDSIVKIYEYVLVKDSLCEQLIKDKDLVIVKQDTIIKLNFYEKKELVKACDLKVKIEKRKKNLWKVIAVGIAALFLIK